MNQWSEELEALPLAVGLDADEVKLVQWPLLQRLVSFDGIFILFLHKKEGGLQEHFPLFNNTLVHVNIFGPVNNMIGLIKVLILNLDLEHHLNP